MYLKSKNDENRWYFITNERKIKKNVFVLFWNSHFSSTNLIQAAAGNLAISSGIIYDNRYCMEQ